MWSQQNPVHVPYQTTASFSEFEWMTRGQALSEDLFVTKGYLKCALHMGKFRNCRSIMEMVMGCEGESINGQEALQVAVVW